MATITNPFQRGQRVLIPAGTPFKSMNPRHDGPQVTNKAHIITVHSTHDGSVQTWDEDNTPAGTVRFPEIVWPGSGGYWQRAQVTPDLLEANGREGLPLPELTKSDLYYLGLAEQDRDQGIPSFEDGYTDRWKVSENA